MQENLDNRLEGLAAGPRNPPGPDCPAPAEWASLVAGTTTPERAQALLDHVVHCDACGSRLRETEEDCSGELSAEEMRALESSNQDWQRRLARRVAGRSWSTGWLAKAAAVVLAVGASLWWGYGRWSAGRPAALLAQAYTAQRPFDYRLPAAAHGPVRLERKGRTSFDRPPALLEAEARIARELGGNPDSAEWLELRARAEMLAWNPEAAIATAERALERKPDDPGLLADLGMAYAMRAESADRAVDYGQAIEHLMRSLRLRPDTPETVFNLAVVYERMFLYDEALRQWSRYLEVDPAGAWADEARRRRDEIELKKKSGRQP